MKHHFLAAALLTVSAFSLSGCGALSSTWDKVGDAWLATEDYVSSKVPTFLKVYRPDVHQGNLITEEMCQHLFVGMSRNQVVLLIGAPLIIDPFHENRWDYVYYGNKLSGEEISRRLTIRFDDMGIVTEIDRDAMPTELEADQMSLGTRRMTDISSKESGKVTAPPPAEPAEPAEAPAETPAPAAQ